MQIGHIGLSLTGVRTPIVSAGYVIPNLAPSSLYNGTEAAGFDPTGVSALVEPTPSGFRTTSDPGKPACGFLFPEREAFVSDRIVSLQALADGGIQNVRWVCEGGYADVNRCTAIQITGYDGQTYVQWGYHVNLDHSAWPVSGWSRLYAIVTPNDPSMNPRIIGPYLIKRKTGSYYDATLNVGSGQTYTTLNAAIAQAGTWCKANGVGGGLGYEHVRIKPVGNLTYDVTSSTSLAGGWTNKGNVDLSCDPGNSLLINKATDGQIDQFGFDFEGMRFGSGVKIDCAGLGIVFAAYSAVADRRRPAFLGCEIYNSRGPYDLGGQYGFLAEKTSRTDGGITGSSTPGGIFCEVYFHDMHIGPVSAQLLRNTVVENCTQDQLRGCDKSYDADIKWTAWYGVTLDNPTLTYWDTEIDAISLTCSEANVTVEASGYVNVSRQLVFKRGGSPAYTTTISFTGTRTGGGGGSGTWAGDGTYTMAQLVSAINARALADSPGTGISGVTATLLDDTRRAATIGSHPAMGVTALSGTPVNIKSRFDIHGDVFQNQGADIENMSVVNLKVLNSMGQHWFNDADTSCDLLTANMVCCFPTLQVGLSREINPCSHVGHMHATFLNQNFYLSTPSYTADANCAMRGGVYTAITYESATTRDNLKITGNRLIGGTTPGGAGVSGNTTGGSIATLFADALGGDITPVGALLTSKTATLVPFDVDGVARGTSLTSPGAKVAAAGG